MILSDNTVTDLWNHVNQRPLILILDSQLNRLSKIERTPAILNFALNRLFALDNNGCGHLLH
jgi:hypothetical protein